MPPQDRAKPQPTLIGFNAWVFNGLVAARGEATGPTAKWIIDRWIEANLELLAEKYGIKREDYQRKAKIVRHPSRSA